jgi:hypothetical protein
MLGGIGEKKLGGGGSGAAPRGGRRGASGGIRTGELRREGVGEATDWWARATVPMKASRPLFVFW